MIIDVDVERIRLDRVGRSRGEQRECPAKAVAAVAAGAIGRNLELARLAEVDRGAIACRQAHRPPDSRQVVRRERSEAEWGLSKLSP